MSGFFARIRALQNIRRNQGLSEDSSLLIGPAREILAFFAGAILAKIAEFLITFPTTNDRDSYLRIVLVFVTILTFALVVYASRISLLIRVLQSSRSHNVFLHRDYTVGKKLRRDAFSFCTSACHKAKKSIIVMGPHYDKNRNRMPDKSHDIYLEDGVDAAVERHLKDENSDFRYERIVQLDGEQFTQTSEKRELDAIAFNNPNMANHVHGMIEKSQQSPTVEISMVAHPYVPSFPSTLVVDDRYVFFSLQTGLLANDEERDQSKANGGKYEYDMVLGIEDLTGEIPTLFRQIILQFKKSGYSINRVVFDNN